MRCGPPITTITLPLEVLTTQYGDSCKVMRELDGQGVTSPMLYCLFIGPNPSGRVNKTMQFIFSFMSQSMRHLKAFRNADQVKTTLVGIGPKTFLIDC